MFISFHLTISKYFKVSNLSIQVIETLKQGSWSHDGFTGDMMRNIANSKFMMSLSQNRGKTPISHIVNVENDVQNVSTIGWFLGGSQILHAPFLTKLELNCFQGFTHVSWVWPQEECATRINILCLIMHDMHSDSNHNHNDIQNDHNYNSNDIQKNLWQTRAK